MKQLLSLLTICLLVLGFTSPSFAQEDRDCGDFSTWKEAQHFYNTHDPDNDPHDLDRDRDGIVCETLAGFDVNYEAGTPLGDATTDTEDRDCGDFSTWKEAQHFYNTHDPDNDPYDLDRDRDGIVCETLAGFDVNYEAGTPLGDATTDTTDPTNDEGAGLADTATYYPVGGTIGLIVGTIGLFLFLFKRRTTIK